LEDLEVKKKRKKKKEEKREKNRGKGKERKRKKGKKKKKETAFDDAVPKVLQDQAKACEEAATKPTGSGVGPNADRLEDQVQHEATSLAPHKAQLLKRASSRGARLGSRFFLWLRLDLLALYFTCWSDQARS
jgi:hypothetical protein